MMNLIAGKRGSIFGESFADFADFCSARKRFQRSASAMVSCPPALSPVREHYLLHVLYSGVLVQYTPYHTGSYYLTY